MTGLARLVAKLFVAGGWAPISVFALHLAVNNLTTVYEVLPAADIPMHLAGGFAMAFFVSRAFRTLPLEPVRSGRLVVLELLLAGSLTATAAVMWEFAEFACDTVLGTNLQISLGNTMRDLADGLLGACSFIAVRAPALVGRSDLLAVPAQDHPVRSTAHGVSAPCPHRTR